MEALHLGSLQIRHDTKNGVVRADFRDEALNMFTTYKLWKIPEFIALLKLGKGAITM